MERHSDFCLKCRCYPATLIAMKTLYQFDFKSDPTLVGWQFEAAQTDGKPVFIPSEGYFPDKGAKWRSPAIVCTGNSFEYYRMTFRSKARGRGYWAVFFHDKHGQEITSDVYASIYPSSGFVTNTVCFRGREGATTFSISFMSTGPSTVEGICIEAVALDDVCRWADTLYAGLPPVTARLCPDSGARLPLTLKRLRVGTAMRWVMLGDSIVNDTNNGLFDVLLKRMYPKADIRVVPSILGSTGCWKYREEPFFQSRVIEQKPDFLMIGGISHRRDIGSIREVIRMTKSRVGCEILLMSGPVGKDCRVPDPDRPGCELPRSVYGGDSFNDEMKALADSEDIEFLDMNTLWHSYVAESATPWEWFHRDELHANDRGKQILARILEQFFMTADQQG
jgi:hypothetical protein